MSWLKWARTIATVLVIAAAVIAAITVFVVSRAGAIDTPGVTKLIKYLAEYFLPLLGIAGAFWLAERGQSGTHYVNPNDYPAVLFALLILSLWVAVPTIALALSESYEVALSRADIIQLAGDPLASAAIAFVFARTSTLN